jgi:hypothetical protein
MVAKAGRRVGERTLPARRTRSDYHPVRAFLKPQVDPDRGRVKLIEDLPVRSPAITAVEYILGVLEALRDCSPPTDYDSLKAASSHSMGQYVAGDGLLLHQQENTMFSRNKSRSPGKRRKPRGATICNFAQRATCIPTTNSKQQAFPFAHNTKM